MKHKLYVLALVGIIGMSSVGAPMVAGAEEIVNRDQAEVVNTLEDVNFGTNDVLDNIVREKRERGTVGNYGKRPIIYKSQVTAAQWNCYKNIAGSMLLSSPSGPYIMLASGLLALSNCK